MERADIIRVLKLSVEELKARQALAEALVLFENGEAEFTRLTTKKALLDAEVQKTKARVEKDMAQMEASATEKIRRVTEQVGLDEKRLMASLSTLKADVFALEGQKAVLQAEMAAEVTRRNLAYGELAAKVREKESALVLADKKLADLKAMVG